MESSSLKLEVTSLIHEETSKTITENGKMGVWKNYKLLIWKMLVQQKRRPISTILELFLPIFFVATLLALRIISVKRTVHDQYVWDGFKVTKEIPSSLSQARSKNWILAYSPNSTYFQKLIQNVPNHLDVKIKGFRNEKMLVDATVLDEDKPMKDQEYLCGVVFDSTPGEFKTRYRLRFPASPRINAKKNSLAPKKWYTQFVYPFVLEGFGPRSAKSKYGGRPSYYNEGFLSVQRAIDFSILETKNSSFNSSNIDVIMRRFPYPRRIADKFLIVIQTMLPMLIMVSLIYSAILMVKNIVYEKENKLKESMIMMGLKGWMHWLAWFTKCFLFLFISMAIITVLLCVRFGNDNGKMLEASDPSVVFVFLLLYCISAISFCFMLSTFFYRASVSAAGSGVLWFLSYSPYFIIFNYLSQMSLQSNLIACIDFNVAMALGAYMIGRFEGQGAGVQWSNIYKGVTVDDDFVFGHVLIMLALDSMFYGIITWYIDGIFPGEFGIPKKWYFPVTKRYWFGTKAKTTRGAHSDDGVDVENKEINASDFIEKEPENLKIGVQIKNLVKNFKTDSGIKVAVNKLNLNMYEGDITALLGHNGAGKTTTISMLTGLFPPTSGNAVINGYDILENIDCVRKSLGICPQHNVLFDLLTVEEHLCFFTYLKGIMKDEDLVKKEVERMIKLIGLEEKRDTQSKYLSGGMKRKLSVGIALTGGSTVVMLDEPTSGMDVSARRFTWDLLQKEKSGRTILLTTHFMDEADVLGDRIAIMADGEIRCCGSSLFLKKKYGVGYHMVLVKNNNFDTKTMTNLIKSYIPNVQLESNIGMEISFILPNDFSHKFEGLFSEIENRREDLGVASFGASVTTLEEVFFKVGETYGSNEITDDQKYVTADSLGRSASTSINEPTEKERISVLNKGITLIVQRWCAMLMKKIIYSKRHKSSIISQFIMPALFVMMAMIAIKVMPKSTSSPPRLITLQMFSSNKVTLKQLGRSTFLQKLSVSYKAEVMDLTSKLPNEPKSNVTNYILELQKIDLPKFNLDHLVALSLNDKTKATATAWFNNEAIHTAPVSLNMLTNALLAMYTGNSTNQISVTNEPLPVTTKQGLSDIMVNPVGFQVGFSLCFGMAFLASSFIVSLVQERASKAKHLQYVSGVDPITYWTSSYFWDLVNFVFPCICVLIIFVAFADECFSGDRLGYVMLLLILYGWAIIPLMYIFSFAFQNASTAFTRMTIFNNVTSMTMMIVVSVLMIPQLDLADVSRTLKWTFMMFPTYCLGQGTVDMFNNYQTIEFFYAAVDLCVETGFPRSSCEKIVEEKFKSEFKMSFQMNYLSWYNPGIGRYLVFLSTEGIVYFLIVFLIEYDLLNKLRTICRGRKTLLRVSSRSNSAYTDDEVPSGSVPAVDFSKSTVSTARERLRSLDDDVIRERERIMKDVRGNDVLVFSELTKVFNPSKNDELVAVDSISLGIPHGECFGLLGQNGAGKTTTFRMLTGDEKITSGLAFVDGFNVNTNLSQARQRIGYCPQFDALIELMTGREILTMYARLRGVQEEDIQPMIDILAKYLTFDMYLDKISKTYSGGNKRKLSTAIALIGDPPLVFLDEPSCGMDPVARRMLWDSLSKLISSGRSIIITSHSMEECEALCTRLAIMVNGQFKCLGSPQHLKNKFGEGYTLVARVGGMNPSTERLQQHIEELFPGSILKDLHDGYVHYQLITDKNWSYIFGEVEKMKGDHDIEDYSVSQTTLEQIFLNFTRTQKVVDE